MAKRRWASVVLVVVSALSNNSWANFTCEGQVTYLGLNPDGLVMMGVNGYGVWYICNITLPFAGNGGINFTAEACRGWYATVLAAQKSGQGIRVFFESPAYTSNGPECTALGTWVTPNPSPYHLSAL